MQLLVFNGLDDMGWYDKIVLHVKETTYTYYFWAKTWSPDTLIEIYDEIYDDVYS